MDDLISRQAAIDAVYKCDDIFVGDMPVMVVKSDAYEALAQLPPAQPTFDARDTQYNLPIGTGLISRAQAIDAARDWYEGLICGSFKGLEKRLRSLPPAQPEIIRCKDCKYWVPGYITDNDDFIPPKCGEWQQMVGHSSDDYCSLAGRRTE